MADSHPSIQILLEQAQAGDAEALGRLLHAHRGYLKVIARRHLGGRLAARVDESDLAQQSCLSAVRNFAAFRGRSPGEFVAWLKGIHERNIQDTLREHLGTEKRKAELEQPLDGDGGLVMESSPSQRVLAGEQAVLLAQSLEELPADQREAVRLRFLEGCSLAEIAERLGRSREAAAGLLKRGLFQLRSRLT